MNEKISRFIDENADPADVQAVFDRLLADDDAHDAWRDYHLIGNVMRGEVSQSGADLRERIRARLEQEPTVLAPSAARVSRLKSGDAGVWKPTAILALAASVALLAVIVLQPTSMLSQNDIAAGNTSTHVDNASEGFQQEFNEMLAQHGRFTSSPGLGGLIGYAKFVSDEPINHESNNQ